MTSATRNCVRWYTRRRVLPGVGSCIDVSPKRWQAACEDITKQVCCLIGLRIITKWLETRQPLHSTSRLQVNARAPCTPTRKLWRISAWHWHWGTLTGRDYMKPLVI